MSPGTRARAPRRGLRPARRSTGGCIFAEDPLVPAPQATIIWHADLDPAVLRLTARGAADNAADVFDLRPIAHLVAAVAGEAGMMHAVVSDGSRRLRLDITGEWLQLSRLHLHLDVAGPAALARTLPPLQRLASVLRRGELAGRLFRNDPRTERVLLALRVYDARVAGASLREIGRELFGCDRVGNEWDGPSDSMRMRVRRLVAEARSLASGKFMTLLKRS